jgi:hypothetical protein
MLMVLGTTLAAIAIGAGLYYFGPDEFRSVPATPGSEAAALSADQAVAVPFTVVAEGDRAATVSARKNYAVYDQEGFDDLWAMAYGKDAPKAPAVDFDKDYVIDVFAGEKSSGGYAIDVEGVSDENALRYVSILHTVPGTGCVTSQALQSPFQIITVPFSDRELARRDKQAEGSCS